MARASTDFIQRAEGERGEFARTLGAPLPQREHVRFTIVTPSGLLSAEAPEDDLGHGRHPLSELFHQGHEVIAAVRLATEA